MTGAREQTSRTAQRKMLLSIWGHGRKIIEQTSDATSSNLSAEDDEVDDQEVKESWVQWKRRVTREALDSLKQIGLPDWADEQRRRLFRWSQDEMTGDGLSEHSIGPPVDIGSPAIHGEGLRTYCKSTSASIITERGGRDERKIEMSGNARKKSSPTSIIETSKLE